MICLAKKIHCSQAVFATFSEELGLTEEQALKIGGCLGSGMRKSEVALEKKLFTEFYPKMVESATRIAEEILKQ